MLLGLILVLGVFVVRAALLLRSTPGYWQDHQAFLADTAPEDMQQLGKDVQARSLREWSYPIGDGDGVRTVRYNFDEVNAWLATRLPAMLENQNLRMPEEIGQVMLTQRDGRLVLAFDYDSTRFGPRIASVFFRFESDEKRPLRGGIRSVRAGEQPLATRYLIDAIANQSALSGEAMQKMLARLSEGKLVELPVIPVDDHRHATVLKLAVEPTGVDVTIRVAYDRE